MEKLDSEPPYTELLQLEDKVRDLRLKNTKYREGKCSEEQSKR